ncbi:hypothetical protein LguiB_005932 [Lonicera macranthoides]
MPSSCAPKLEARDPIWSLRNPSHHPKFVNTRQKDRMKWEDTEKGCSYQFCDLGKRGCCLKYISFTMGSRGAVGDCAARLASNMVLPGRHDKNRRVLCHPAKASEQRMPKSVCLVTLEHHHIVTNPHIVHNISQGKHIMSLLSQAYKGFNPKNFTKYILRLAYLRTLGASWILLGARGPYHLVFVANPPRASKALHNVSVVCQPLLLLACYGFRTMNAKVEHTLSDVSLERCPLCFGRGKPPPQGTRGDPPAILLNGSLHWMVNCNGVNNKKGHVFNSACTDGIMVFGTETEDFQEIQCQPELGCEAFPFRIFTLFIPGFSTKCIKLLGMHNDELVISWDFRGVYACNLKQNTVAKLAIEVSKFVSAIPFASANTKSLVRLA